MHTIIGTWDVSLKTPVGTLKVRYTFTEDGGRLAGTAEGQGETGALEAIAVEPTADGERVTWSQKVTRPVRLNLDFDVVATGDVLQGQSHAGRLPRTQVSGTRRAG
ncbi:hypothetical protein [Promicromonospora sp. NPDC060271]|uniref:hypothetical protein n=1 Tax=Promicromonospora sp. NPDC060271 TaxID=3347089 RepID=UPI0036541C98